MTTDRCPACNAAVSAGAEWCTLCYAVLRVRETVPPAPAAPTGPAVPVILNAPLPPDAVLDAPVDKAPAIARVPAEGWPCLGCGALVPLADNACNQCGRPFLPSEGLPSLALPVVGDLTRLDKPQRVALMIGGCIALTAVLFVLAFILGSIL